MKKNAPEETGMKELKNALKTGDFSRLYFFHGEERYLQEHYLAALKKKVVSGPMEEFNFRRLTAENMSIEALQDAVEAMPMMAEMTLVQVDDYNPYAQNEETRESLISIFSDIPDTCCLVFNFDIVKFSYGAEKESTEEEGKKSASKNKKLLKACIEENGCIVEFQKQTPAALAEWIARHFREQEKTISPDLCQHLIFLTGGDMTLMHTEIGKVAAYSRMPAISRQDIDAVVEPVLTAVLFDITDALAEGNYDKALMKLQDVLHTKEEPISILGAVGSHFRKLLTAKTVHSAGKGADALLPLLNSKSDFYARKVMSQAGRLSETMCLRAVELCYETDRKLKRSFDDANRLLEFLLLELAQEARK